MRVLDRFDPNLNWQLIVPVVSGAMVAVGAGLAVTVGIALASGASLRIIVAFSVPAAATLTLSGLGLFSARHLRSVPIQARDGFFAVTASWVSAAAVGAVPFLVAGVFSSPIDAFFESMSGFTTTGATLIGDVSAQPDAILFWRSISQWIGGVGIVVLVVAIAPATGLATQRVFYAEATGAAADRLTPRIADTAKILWGIYLAFTAIGFTAFLAAGMTPFEAVNHVFTAVSAGGFSTETGSIGAFDSVAVELIAVGLMIAGTINFVFYWKAVKGSGIWPQAAEVRFYFVLLLVGMAAVTAGLVLSEYGTGFWATFRESAFAVVTTMTGTGYQTADFNSFNDFARGWLLILLFIGGCAGSTAGGLKVIRVMLLGKTAGQEVRRRLQPKAVQVLRTRGRIFSEEARRGVLGFFYIYMAVAIAGTMAMLATGLDGLTAFSSVAATLNIAGPGMGEVGALEGFAAVPAPGRLVLTFLMLAGRLEIFAVLVLLTPAFWRPSTG